VGNIVNDIPPQPVDGPENGDLLVLSWGGTYGVCTTAVKELRTEGLSVAHAHLRYLNPFPGNPGQVLASYRRVFIPELNQGQLDMLIRAKYSIEPACLTKMEGKPFTVEEITERIRDVIR